MSRQKQAASQPENRILASLPRQEYQRILPDLKHVSLALGDVLYEADETIRFVYFPIRSVVSFIWNTGNSLSVEVGMVGSEGMTGISIISGINALPYRTIVQGADGAMRMKANALIAEFNRVGLGL